MSFLFETLSSRPRLLDLLADFPYARRLADVRMQPGEVGKQSGRFLRLVFHKSNSSKIQVGISGRTGVKFHDPHQILFRLVQMTELVVAQRDLVVNERVVGSQGQGARLAFERLTRFPADKFGHSEIQPPLEQCWGDGDGTPETIECVVVVSLKMTQCSQIDEGLR